MKCSVCNGATFGPGPGGRLSSTGLLPQCLGCGSLERHRAVRNAVQEVVTVLRRETMPLRCLQFAPDKSVEPSWFSEYRGLDFETDRVDIQDSQLPGAAFDVVVCNHVLEHVPDDLAAIGELLRVTTEHGAVLLTVPRPSAYLRTEDWGFPDPKLEFHYRNYGLDSVLRFACVSESGGGLAILATDQVTGDTDLVTVLVKDEGVGTRIQSAINNRPSWLRALYYSGQQLRMTFREQRRLAVK